MNGCLFHFNYIDAIWLQDQAFQSVPENFSKDRNAFHPFFLSLVVCIYTKSTTEKKKKKPVDIKGILEGHPELISSIDPTLPIA